MPRLTMEALMAPGGLLDAGSRLTQSLVETPFKRAALNQEIQSQELGRAEQKKIRSEAFAREDKAIARGEAQKTKDQQLGVLTDEISKAERRAETALSNMLNAKQAKFEAAVNRLKVSDEYKHKLFEFGKAIAPSIPELQALGIKTPEQLGNYLERTAKTFMAGIGMSPEQALQLAGAAEFGKDDNTTGEFLRAMDVVTKVSQERRQLVGLADDTRKTREFVSKANTAFGAPAADIAPISADRMDAPVEGAMRGPAVNTGRQKSLAAPGSPAAFGQLPYEQETPEEELARSQAEAAAKRKINPTTGTAAMTDLSREILMGQTAMHSPGVQANIDISNQQNAAATALDQSAYNSKERFFQNAPGVALPLTDAARTAPRSSGESPHAGAWSKLLADFSAASKFTPEQQARFDLEIAGQIHNGPGSLGSLPDITQHMLDEKYGGLSRNVSPEERKNMGNVAFYKIFGKRLSNAAVKALSP